MKRCPNCATDYFDDMLEFCLEDGARLAAVSKLTMEQETQISTKPFASNPFTEKTFNLPRTEEAQTIENIKPGAPEKLLPATFALEKSLAAGSKVLEIAPVVIALAHNWWQWLYAVNQPTGSISGFVFSAGFLGWLLLLAVGAGLGWLAVKRCENRGYAYLSLVILSINLILFLVPKR